MMHFRNTFHWPYHFSDGREIPPSLITCGNEECTVVVAAVDVLAVGTHGLRKAKATAVDPIVVVGVSPHRQRPFHSLLSES